MYKFLKEAHSGLAYLVLLALVISTVYYFIQYFSKKNLNPKSKTIALVTMIVVHLQFLLGIILYFVSPIIKSGLKDFGASMSDSAVRLQILEHPTMMLIAVVFVTLAHRFIKARSLANKTMSLNGPVFFLVALLFVLSRVPWQTWLA